MKKKKCKPGKHCYQINTTGKVKNGVPLWMCVLCGDKVYSS
jgi:hypothetical protein